MILSQGVFCIILYLTEFLYNSHFEFFSGNSSLFLSSLPEEELPCFLSSIKVSLVYCVSLSVFPTLPFAYLEDQFYQFVGLFQQCVEYSLSRLCWPCSEDGTVVDTCNKRWQRV